jgi:hypothetical protein
LASRGKQRLKSQSVHVAIKHTGLIPRFRFRIEVEEPDVVELARPSSVAAFAAGGWGWACECDADAGRYVCGGAVVDAVVGGSSLFWFKEVACVVKV